MSIEERRAQLQAELAQLDTEENAAKVVPVQFPGAGESWDPTKEPPPDAAVGSEHGWQPAVEDAVTAPPPSAPTDPAAAAQEEHPEETISETSFDVVAGDGSTERNTPGYSDVPCPVCHNTSLKTTNVQAATPVATLRGETVSPGDQVVVCESCSTTISAGDVDRFLEEARAGGYGPGLQEKLAEPKVDVEAERKAIDEEQAQLVAQHQALEERRARLKGGGSGGISETEGGGA